MIYLSREEYDLLFMYAMDIDRQYAHYYNSYSLDYTKEQIENLCIDRFLKEINNRRDLEKKEHLSSDNTNDIKVFITTKINERNNFIQQQNDKIQQEITDSLNLNIVVSEEPIKKDKKKINMPLPEPYNDYFVYIGEQYDELKKLQPI